VSDVEPATMTQRLMSSNPAQQPSAAPKTVRILIAEDSPLNAEVALAHWPNSATRPTGSPTAQGCWSDPANRLRHHPHGLPNAGTQRLRDHLADPGPGEECCGGRYRGAARLYHRHDGQHPGGQSGKMRGGRHGRFHQKAGRATGAEAALHRGLADRTSQKALEEIIDPVVIAGLRQLRIPGKPDPLARLIDLFLQEAPGQIQALETAVAQNDFSSLSRTFSAAVSLKGGASNLGRAQPRRAL